VKLAIETFCYAVRQKDNEYPNGEDPEFGTWEKVLESGRSYLVGSDTPMPEYLRRHSSSLTTWQKHAYEWCLANPSRCLVLESRPLRRMYEILCGGLHKISSVALGVMWRCCFSAADNAHGLLRSAT
jgi:hypothetical protein